MARRPKEANEIRESATVAYDQDARIGAIPPDVASGETYEESDFRYGFRQRKAWDAEGREVFEDIPLTPEDYLHPLEGDVMTQGNPHERMLGLLADVLRRWLERIPGVGVFSDVLVRWGIADLPNQAPDVAVVRGLADPAEVGGSLDCAALGVKPCLAIELVSTTHKEYREKDTRDKLRIYQQAGVTEYLIIDPTGRGKGEPFQLIGYRLDAAGQYREIAPEDHGALRSETVGLRLVPSAERGVVVEVAATGERLLYSDEAEAALRSAETRAREAERRATEAEERLARLLAEKEVQPS